MPKIQNLVATVNLNCRIDLKVFAQQARNVEYNPKRFHAAIMRIRNPKTTTLVFASGKMVITGAKSEADARLAARKHARLIQKCGFRTQFLDYKVQNFVGSCVTGLTVRLEGLMGGEYSPHRRFCSYEPEIFPGLVYRMLNPAITLLIFANGKVVLTGAKKGEDLFDAFASIYPILLDYKVE